MSEGLSGVQVLIPAVIMTINTGNTVIMVALLQTIAHLEDQSTPGNGLTSQTWSHRWTASLPDTLPFVQTLTTLNFDSRFGSIANCLYYQTMVQIDT